MSIEWKSQVWPNPFITNISLSVCLRLCQDDNSFLRGQLRVSSCTVVRIWKEMNGQRAVKPMVTSAPAVRNARRVLLPKNYRHFVYHKFILRYNSHPFSWKLWPFNFAKMNYSLKDWIRIRAWGDDPWPCPPQRFHFATHFSKLPGWIEPDTDSPKGDVNLVEFTRNNTLEWLSKSAEITVVLGCIAPAGQIKTWSGNRICCCRILYFGCAR